MLLADDILSVQDDRMRGRRRLSSGYRTLRLRGFRETFEERQGHREVEHLGDHLAPTVEEVAPPVVELESTVLLLSPRLLEEPEVAAVVQLPDEAALRERGVVGDRRAGCVLAEPRRVDDERAGRERLEQGVVLGCRAHVLE